MKSKKKTFGEDIVEKLRALNEAIKTGKPVAERFACDRVLLDLQPRDYTPKMVKDIRRLLGISQGLFAQFLGISPGTVKAWEQGTNPVPGVACRFMDEIKLKPDFFQQRIKDSIVDKQMA